MEGPIFPTIEPFAGFIEDFGGIFDPSGSLGKPPECGRFERIGGRYGAFEKPRCCVDFCMAV